MHTDSRTPRRRWWLGSLTAAAGLALFWSPALRAPYWQDDYFFLLGARRARLHGESWLRPFWPESPEQFWRPLSMETYWRVIEGVFGGDPLAAHAANLALLLAAAAAVGSLAAAVMRSLGRDAGARWGGLTAAFLYGVHASHFLPAAWAAAANDSIVVLFSALALRFWVAGLDVGRRQGRGGASVHRPPTSVFAPRTWRRFRGAKGDTLADSRGKPAAAVSLALAPICFALALLSKEIAVVLPVFGWLLALWVSRGNRPSRRVWAVGGLCVVMAAVYLVVRQHTTTPPPPAYQMRLGANVARNAASLALFSFNVPRESLRFVLVERSTGAACWGLAALAIQAAAFGLILRAARRGLDRRAGVVLGAMFAVGCGPYLLLAWNCYAYYLSIALLAYALLVALAVACRGRGIPLAVALAVASSAVSTWGNYALDDPSLLGRARWAQRQLQVLAAEKSTLAQQAGRPRLAVRVEDEHRFQGFGVPGLAYTLGLESEAIVVLGPDEPAPTDVPVLVVPQQEDVRLVPPR